MFSIVGLTFVSTFYFGALSRRLGGFGWGGTALVGYSLGLWGQILIFLGTWVSFVAGIETSYFRHWDAQQYVALSLLSVGLAKADSRQCRVGS